MAQDIVTGCARIEDVDQLGPRAALFTLSLLDSSATGSPIAPTSAATGYVLNVLEALGVIETEAHVTLGSPRATITANNWRYTWCLPIETLPALLEKKVRETSHDSAHHTIWLCLWKDLIHAEAIAYLENQLEWHGFTLDPIESLPVHPYSIHLYSLGQWRYAIWAAVRAMASASLKHPGDRRLLQRTLNHELQRRLTYAKFSPSEKLTFSPHYLQEESALTRNFSTVATDLREQFWRVPPTLRELTIGSTTASQTNQQSRGDPP